MTLTLVEELEDAADMLERCGRWMYERGEDTGGLAIRAVRLRARAAAIRDAKERLSRLCQGGSEPAAIGLLVLSQVTGPLAVALPDDLTLARDRRDNPVTIAVDTEGVTADVEIGPPKGTR